MADHVMKAEGEEVKADMTPAPEPKKEKRYRVLEDGVVMVGIKGPVTWDKDSEVGDLQVKEEEALKTLLKLLW